MNHTEHAIEARNSITLEEFKTLLDVVNVYDPNDIAHVYPEMGSPEFMQDVRTVFKKLLDVVKNHPENQPNHLGTCPEVPGSRVGETTLTQEELDGVKEDSK